MSPRLVLPIGKVSRDSPRGHPRGHAGAPTHRRTTGPGRRNAGNFPRVRTFPPSHSAAPSLSGAALALALMSGVLVGCGATEDDAPAAPANSPVAPAPSATTPPPSPDPTGSPDPSELPGGSGDSEEDDKPATAGGGICSDLEAEDVGDVLGGTVTGTGLPPGGCEFAQRAAAAPAATFVETSFAATAGGMDGAKNNATASVEGEPADLPGVGSAAFVVTGTQFGGDDVQGAGAVRVGDRLVQVTLAQAVGLSRSAVRTLVVDLLRLAAAQAS